MYLGRLAARQPAKPAVINASTGEALTYAALDRRSNQIANLLRAHGLKRGDHVALLMENSLAIFEIFWGCMRAGVYFTPINHHLSAAEAAYIVNNCDANALFVSARLEQAAQLGAAASRCAIKLSAFGATPGFDDYETVIARQSPDKIADESLGAMMLYSSGTTGRPKGVARPLPEVPIEQGSPHLHFVAQNAGFDAQSVYLSTAPMYHGAPITYTSAAIQAGGTVVMMERFDAEAALTLIERYRVTHSQWVPTMFIRLLRLAPETRARFDLSSHRRALHAAAPCPVEVKRQMIAWWGPIIDEYYSSTENAAYTWIGSEEWLRKPGSVGRTRGAPLHICDDDGAELPPGVPGLVYGEPPAPGFTYYKDEEKTASTMHPRHPHWRAVGDIGYLDEDGYLFLTDRKAFMIISGGVNIYPQQIENALALHPAIADVAVIGVPNSDLGEEAKAIVQLAPGFSPSPDLAKALIDFVKDRLGAQLAPRSVDFTGELPRLPTGKLYKQQLRDRYWPPTIGNP